ncbi:MAG: hypothetical protein LBI03_03265 [Clostridiales bacterium]|jgi:hypothetical protein|nr:hypothetical protein [Clostridiales bacterium]
MSYSIIYGRQFLRAEDKFIPLVISGCNNDWEIDYSNKRRRSKNWHPMMKNLNSTPLLTSNEIMDEVQIRLGNDEHFMWHSHWADDSAYIAFFKNGIKNASTLEELQGLALNPHEVYLHCYLSVWCKDGTGESKNTVESQKNIYSTEELLAYMNEVSIRIKNKKQNETSIYVNIEFPYDKAVKYPKEIRKRKPAERLDSNYWVIKVNRKTGDKFFIAKLSAQSLRYAHTVEGAKQFKTQAIAKKWVSDKDIKIRFGNIEGFEFHHIV